MIEGESEFPSSFALEFFYTINIHPTNHTVFKFGSFPSSLTIFRRLCSFSRHLAQMIRIQKMVHEKVHRNGLENHARAI